MLQRANDGSRVATQEWARRTGTGILFDDWADTARQLRQERATRAIRSNVIRHRPELTFDAHVPRLEAFLRQTIDRRRSRPRASRRCASATSLQRPTAG
jgi:hypothetical protein